jgi:hypothetical protein
LKEVTNLPQDAFYSIQKDIVQSSSYNISQEENILLADIEKKVEKYLSRRKQINLLNFISGIVNPRYSTLLEEQMHLTKKHLKYTLEYQRQLSELDQ